MEPREVVLAPLPTAPQGNNVYDQTAVYVVAICLGTVAVVVAANALLRLLRVSAKVHIEGPGAPHARNAYAAGYDVYA